MVRKPFRIGEILRAKHNSICAYVVVDVNYMYETNTPVYDVKVIGVKKDKKWILDVNDTVYSKCSHKLFTRMPRKAP